MGKMAKIQGNKVTQELIRRKEVFRKAAANWSVQRKFEMATRMKEAARLIKNSKEVTDND